MQAITMLSIIIILVIVPNFSCTSIEATNKIFCVGNNSSFCQNYKYSEHHILAYYLNHSSKYFKSHETSIFQPGKHSLVNDIGILHVTNVTNLTLTGLTDGSNVAIIDCDGKFAAFHFASSSNTTIEHLTFSECISKHFGNDHSNNGLATLFFHTGIHLSLIGVTIWKSIDESFLILNIFGDVIINNIVAANASTAGIQRNKAGNSIVYTNCERRGLSRLYITDSIFANNSVSFKKHHITFHAGGLSINLKCPNVTVKINNVTMSNNKGYTGGNLAILFDTFQTNFSVSVEILNSIIEHGHASEGGGGIYAEFVVSSSKTNKATPMLMCPENYHQHHQLLHIYNTSINKNAVTYQGGGVYLRQKQSLILCSREEIKFTNVTFRDNSVMKTGFGGIAIHSINFMVTDYLYHRSPQYFVILERCHMYNNYAISQTEDGSGTGVIFTKSNHYFLLNNSVIFNNKVTGIVGMSSNIILSRNITIFNNTFFK